MALLVGFALDQQITVQKAFHGPRALKERLGTLDAAAIAVFFFKQKTAYELLRSLVRYTLEPAVYEGPAEGKPKEEWRLRPAGELLALKICDMAMGSGAFLVQACRYLAERLVEAWAEAEAAHPGRLVITPEGALSTGLPEERPIPRDGEERLVMAMRIVADRCLYGVEVNPMAVEMAKLSLWLTTLSKERPFTFLDHALRSGDSLLGLTGLDQLEAFHIDARQGRQLLNYTKAIAPHVQRACVSGSRRR